jgi:hypothetical protein
VEPKDGLPRFKQIYENTAKQPGLRLVAAIVLDLKSKSDANGSHFKVYATRRKKWDALVTIELGPYTFRISASIDDQWGNYLIELAFGGAAPDWSYLYPDGTTDQDQASHSWWVFNSEYDDVDNYAKEVSDTIWTCGRWHRQKLGGAMSKCDGCGFQPVCKIKYGYVITGGSS